MSFRLGLTGSIGMGKSTTAGMFADLGCDVWDADAAVHRLYGAGGEGIGAIGARFPEAIVQGIVSRGVLKHIISERPLALKEIERIIHPLVSADRADFCRTASADILVFDIPLLYETGGEQAMDGVAVVSVSKDVQEERVMSRGSMTRSQFLEIKNSQMSDADKRARADYIIITDTIENARRQVQDIVNQIRAKI